VDSINAISESARHRGAEYRVTKLSPTGDSLRAWHARTDESANCPITTKTMMRFNEPYDYKSKEPLEIKNDFIDYVMGCDVHGMETILRALTHVIPSEQLGEYMDDMMMGRL